MSTTPAIRIGRAAISTHESAILANRFGAFDSKSGEFTLRNILTPRPWVNVMSNGRYGLVLSQMGGGFSWLDNCQLGRISRWEQDLSADGYGRWVYVYDRDADRVHSTTYAPTRGAALEEEVRHGLGYSYFRRRFDRFESTQTVFVPEGVDVEHALIEIRNLTDSSLELVLGSYLEWFLGGQGDWHREFHRLFMEVEVDEDRLIARKRAGLQEGTRETSDRTLAGFVHLAGLGNIDWFSDKAQWLGREGRLDRPEGLVGRFEPRVTGRWDDPIAAFRANVLLPANASIRFGLTVGAGADGAAFERPSLETIERRLVETRNHHQERCSVLKIETADPAIDLMANSWLPYQAEVGRMKARCAYYQQGGAYGFRDQLQDSLFLLDSEPQATLRQIGLHAEAMYEDGGVRHWWHPDTEIAVESRHSDTCLWLAYATLDYLDETADLTSLDRPNRFLNRTTQAPGREGTLLEHCQRGIDRFLERRSARGLPLIGAGDWNDGLSHVGIEGKGESVWLAMFGFQILQRMAHIYRRLGMETDAIRASAEAESLRIAVEAHGWDGQWYIAGTRDDGRPFGASENEEGRIFLNPQTWAAITGIGSPQRISSAMEAVRRHLIKPYGALLLSPAYAQTDPTIGYITRYAPGLRENGGVYSHASTWAAQAFAIHGDAATAYRIFRSMLPPVRAEQDADSYQAEPYVMPGNVDGPDSPFEGRAGWTWYTGSAAWMRRIALHHILGIRPSFDGLVVEPHLANELGPIRMRRPFRGDVFEIEIEAGDRHRISLDGHDLDRGPIPASGRNRTRTLRLAALR